MIEAGEGESRDGSRWQWVAGAVAVVLAVAIVAGLVLLRHRSSAQPAASGRPLGALNMTTQLDFHCALPVQGYLTQARVTMPDGGVTADHELSAAKGMASTPGSSYAGGRWLPVPFAWVSADASSYAYIASTTGVPGQAPTSTLFVHDLARNADRQLWSGSGSAQMIGWGPGGVYFGRQGIPAGPVGPSMELWVVDPANSSGAHRVGPNSAQPPASPDEPQAPLLQTPPRIAGGAAWSVSFGVPQKVAAPGGIGFPPSRVVRMDLKDGSLSTWFTAPDAASISLAAIDQQGRPVIIVTAIPVVVTQPAAPGTVPSPPSLAVPSPPPPPRVLLLTAKNETVEIANGSDPAFRPYTASGDSHGVWFASPGSLWIYRQGALVKVADVPAGLFPLPPPPSNLASPPPNLASPAPNVAKPPPPPGFPIGVTLMLAGPCQ
jgi:hypothetical protein